MKCTPFLLTNLKVYLHFERYIWVSNLLPLLPLSLVVDSEKGTRNSKWPPKYPSWFVYLTWISLVSTKFPRENKKVPSNGFCCLKQIKPLRIMWLACFSLTLELLELIFYFVAVISWVALIVLESSVRFFCHRACLQCITLADKNCSWKEGKWWV